MTAAQTTVLIFAPTFGLLFWRLAQTVRLPSNRAVCLLAVLTAVYWTGYALQINPQWGARGCFVLAFAAALHGCAMLLSRRVTGAVVRRHARPATLGTVVVLVMGLTWQNTEQFTALASALLAAHAFVIQSRHAKT